MSSVESGPELKPSVLCLRDTVLALAVAFAGSPGKVQAKRMSGKRLLVVEDDPSRGSAAKLAVRLAGASPAGASPHVAL
jgi:hypothetical protein